MIKWKERRWKKEESSRGAVLNIKLDSFFLFLCSHMCVWLKEWKQQNQRRLFFSCVCVWGAGIVVLPGPDRSGIFHPAMLPLAEVLIMDRYGQLSMLQHSGQGRTRMHNTHTHPSADRDGHNTKTQCYLVLNMYLIYHGREKKGATKCTSVYQFISYHSLIVT